MGERATLTKFWGPNQRTLEIRGGEIYHHRIFVKVGRQTADRQTAGAWGRGARARGLAPGVRLGVEVCGTRHPPTRPREFDQRIAQRVHHAEVEATGRARVGQRHKGVQQRAAGALVRDAVDHGDLGDRGLRPRWHRGGPARRAEERREEVGDARHRSGRQRVGEAEHGGAEQRLARAAGELSLQCGLHLRE